MADGIPRTRRRTPADDQPVRVLPGVAGRRRHPVGPQGAKPARMLADRRMARPRRTTIALLAVHPARQHQENPTRPSGETTLARRTRLPRTEDRPRPGPLRRPQMGRLAPPRHPRRRRPRVPHLAPAPPKSISAGMTLYGVLRKATKLRI